MTKEEFNKYCAEVMGHEIVEAPKVQMGTYYPVGVYVSDGGSGRWNYNPYFNLNQMAEVFDKLRMSAYWQDEMNSFHNNMYDYESMAIAMRKFIESTHD